MAEERSLRGEAQEEKLCIKVAKIGNSLRMTLPKVFCKPLGIKEGDIMILNLNGQDVIDVRVVKVGNSLRLTLPKAICRSFDIQAGDELQLDLKRNEVIIEKVVRHSKLIKIKKFLFDGINPNTR
jgi:AbrB family looped-hinge helix DNA binding protein